VSLDHGPSASRLDLLVDNCVQLYQAKLNATAEHNRIERAGLQLLRQQNGEYGEGPDDAPVEQSVRSLIEHADALVVLVEEGKIGNMIISESPDEPDVDSRLVDQKRWTCQRDYIGDPPMRGVASVAAVFEADEPMNHAWKHLKVTGEGVRKNMGWFI
jgi:hypothetical protein